MSDAKVYKHLKKLEFYLFLIWVIVKIVLRENYVATLIQTIIGYFSLLIFEIFNFHFFKQGFLEKKFHSKIIYLVVAWIIDTQNNIFLR